MFGFLQSISVTLMKRNHSEYVTLQCYSECTSTPVALWNMILVIINLIILITEMVSNLSTLCPVMLPLWIILLLVADAKGSIREIILPKGLDLDRPKRTRTSFTAEQLYRLEMEFQRCQYVVGRERTELARQLNLSETQVCTQQRRHGFKQSVFMHRTISFFLLVFQHVGRWM